jgi:hypothetical protein
MPFVTTTWVTDLPTGSPPVIRTASPERAVLKTVGVQDDNGDNADIQVAFPFGPRDVSYDTIETKFVQIARPGKKPILAKQNQQLSTVTFKAVIADKESGGVLPVVDLLDDLTKIAENGYVCKFVYAHTSLPFFVAVTKFSYNVKYRNSSGEATSAEASFQLTELPTINQEIAELLAIYRTPTYTKAIPAEPAPDPKDEALSLLWNSMQQPARYNQLIERATRRGDLPPAEDITDFQQGNAYMAKLEELWRQSFEDTLMP